MCFDERNTDSRARPRAASLILRRTVAVRRAVRSVNLDMARPLLLLAFLAEDVLVDIFHALALVGLGRTESADFGGDVSHLVDAVLDALDTGQGQPPARSTVAATIDRLARSGLLAAAAERA